MTNLRRENKFLLKNTAEIIQLRKKKLVQERTEEVLENLFWCMRLGRLGEGKQGFLTKARVKDGGRKTVPSELFY